MSKTVTVAIDEILLHELKELMPPDDSVEKMVEAAISAFIERSGVLILPANYGGGISAETITIDLHPVRTLVRSSVGSRMLSNLSIRWVPVGTTLYVGSQQRMSYDHGDYDVRQVLGLNQERFIIMAELGEGA